MRALLCSCKDRLTASDNEALFRVVVDHLSDYHPVVRLDEEELREAIAVHSFELTEVVVVGAKPDEEFGIDPYKATVVCPRPSWGPYWGSGLLFFLP